MRYEAALRSRPDLAAYAASGGTFGRVYHDLHEAITSERTSSMELERQRAVAYAELLDTISALMQTLPLTQALDERAAAFHQDPDALLDPEHMEIMRLLVTEHLGRIPAWISLARATSEANKRDRINFIFFEYLRFATPLRGLLPRQMTLTMLVVVMRRFVDLTRLWHHIEEPASVPDPQLELGPEDVGVATEGNEKFILGFYRMLVVLPPRLRLTTLMQHTIDAHIHHVMAMRRTRSHMVARENALERGEQLRSDRLDLEARVERMTNRYNP